MARRPHANPPRFGYHGAAARIHNSGHHDMAREVLLFAHERLDKIDVSKYAVAYGEAKPRDQRL
jgi:hypothetical protein